MISVKKDDIVYCTLTLILVLIASFSIIATRTLVLWIVIFLIIKLLQTKNNIFVIIQLFMLWFFLSSVFYFVFNDMISTYQPIDDDNYNNMLAVLKIQSVFIVSFLTFAPIKKEFVFSKEKIIYKNNVAWFVSFLMMICGLLLVDWNGIVEYFGAIYSVETESSIMFDYFMVFVVINSFFCDKKWKKIFDITMSIFISVLCILLGKRLTAITNILLIYILFFDGKLKKRTIIIGFMIGTIFFNAIQFIRVGNVPSVFNCLTGINIVDGIYRSNPGDVWYASEVIYKLIDNGVFDWTFRIKSFFGTFMNSFLPTSLTPKEALVNIYITENELFPYTANGGFIGVSTYLWLGYPGVVLFSYIIGKIIKRGFINTRIFTTAYAILVLATFPRWYTYNPRILFKFLFVLFVVYLFVVLISNTLNKRVR